MKGRDDPCDDWTGNLQNLPKGEPNALPSNPLPDDVGNLTVPPVDAPKR